MPQVGVGMHLRGYRTRTSGWCRYGTGGDYRHVPQVGVGMEPEVSIGNLPQVGVGMDLRSV